MKGQVERTMDMENECIAIQKELAKRIEPRCPIQPRQIETVAGVDLAYWEADGREQAVCCIAVLDYRTLEVAERREAAGEVRFPYIPGCLAFRELPLVLKAAGKLSITPDVWMFDGNGYLHPRRMGLAVHASFFLRKPAIGIAKSYYKIGGADYAMPENAPGAYTEILVEGEVRGRALRTHVDVKPVFLSAGNWMDLDTATEIAMACVGKESRVPLPTRLADLDTHRARTALGGGAR